MAQNGMFGLPWLFASLMPLRAGGYLDTTAIAILLETGADFSCRKEAVARKIANADVYFGEFKRRVPYVQGCVGNYQLKGMRSSR